MVSDGIEHHAAGNLTFGLVCVVIAAQFWIWAWVRRAELASPDRPLGGIVRDIALFLTYTSFVFIWYGVSWVMRIHGGPSLHDDHWVAAAIDIGFLLAVLPLQRTLIKARGYAAGCRMLAGGVLIATLWSLLVIAIRN